MIRRRFLFWLSFGAFSVAEKLRLGGIDALAAAAMNAVNEHPAKKTRSVPLHWTVAEDDEWRWYEREHFIDGQWWLTGTTTPIHKKTGQRKRQRDAYLEDDLVPEGVQLGSPITDRKATPAEVEPDTLDLQLPSSRRRNRHGRPPSKWLRSLHADELRIWLKTVDCPEAGVEGMTYWEHLTRDHAFDPEKIEGLTEPEQAKLHAAAHFGF